MNPIPPSGGTSNAVRFAVPTVSQTESKGIAKDQEPPNGQRRRPAATISTLRRQRWQGYVESALRCTERNERAEAEEMWRLALRHAESERASDAEIGGILLGLAELLYIERRAQEALHCCVAATASLKRAYGEQHPKVGGSLNLEASIYFAQSLYEDAYRSCTEAHAIFQRALGESSSDTVVTTYNLAMIHHALGRFLHAERYYRKALVLIRKTSCTGVNRKAIIDNYSGLLDRTGRYEEAIKLRETV